jgi:nitroimidazol reductase NimA-like FMN-containing flavoprotein (pyridoxamine 5'-phosphate oxidase superfamily)
MHRIQENSEKMSREEMERLLRKVTYGHLGMAFENEAYVVPVSHIYDGEHIWFHIEKEGKKTTYLQANPQACYQVDECEGENWVSVICYGTVILSDDLESRRHFAKLAPGHEACDDELQNTSVYICSMTIDEMTGRKCQGHAR